MASSDSDHFAQSPSQPIEGLVLTVSEAAELLRLDPRTVRHLFATGVLEGNRIGHAIRLSRVSVLDWASGKRRVSRSRR